MQLLVQIKVQALKISLLVLVINLLGCAAEPFLTDEGSAAVQHVHRQNIEFLEKGVLRRPMNLPR